MWNESKLQRRLSEQLKKMTDYVKNQNCLLRHNSVFSFFNLYEFLCVFSFITLRMLLVKKGNLFIVMYAGRNVIRIYYFLDSLIRGLKGQEA